MSTTSPVYDGEKRGYVIGVNHANGSVPQLNSYGDVLPPDQYDAPALPSVRGPLSEWVLTTLRRSPGPCSLPPTAADDPVTGDDSALALYVLYELHYRGFEGVDADWEWQPELLAGRAQLERRFLDRLQQEVPMASSVPDIVAALRERTAAAQDPTFAQYYESHASWEQMREMCVHRSAWQLKEADPHSWALPRLGGRPKAALAEVQGGEYGDGNERDVHQNLYALTLSLMGLDSRYGRYLDVLPGVTLATVNLVTFFGLHRSWLPAMVGHLAAFEMSSVAPMACYSAAMRRLGAAQDACHFFDAHVVADQHHQNVAAEGLAAGLVEQDPRCAPLIVFGADALGWTEEQFSTYMNEHLQSGTSSLLRPLPAQVKGTVNGPGLEL
jgi:hypothetical protein